MLSRTSRILLVVAAIAVIAYLLLDRASDDDKKEDTARLATFNMADVDDVTLQRADATLRFAREDSVWRMTAPVQDIAEPTAVIPLLHALEHADVARNLGATDDLVPFGLDPPEVKVTLRAGRRTLLEAELGKRTVDEGWTYARSASRDLLLVPTDVARAASLPVNAYRNQRVLDFQTHDITRYELRTKNESMTWTRRGHGWSTTQESGDTIAGDSVAVEAVLRRLRGLRVGSFMADADTVLVEPVTTLTVWQADDTQFATVAFWRREERWFAYVDRYQRTVVIDDVSDLVGLTRNALRDRRVLKFSPEDAVRITFTYPTVSGELVRAGGAWSFPNPAMGRIDPKQAADFVRALRALKWDGPAYASAASDSKFGISIVGVDGRILDQVSIEARDSEPSWYVSSSSAKGSYMIERGKLDHLATLFQRVRAR
jgi:hypothetical protein